MAMVPAVAESAPGSGRTVPMTRDWGSVPTIPLRPPVAMTPPGGGGQIGNWSSGGGWRGGQGRWHQGMPGQWGQWRGQPGNWNAWRGGHGRFAGHFRPRPGFFMPRFFVSPTFFVSNWWSYGLAEPGAGRRWVRYYDDAVLIDDRGYIYDTAPGVDWDSYGPTPEDYDRDYDDRFDDHAMSWGPGVYHVPHGAGVYYAPAGSTTVIIQSAPVVTTTTTTTYEEVAYAKPRKAWKPRRKCACK
jgi:Ni/Co efflux regulator RcnB